MAQGSDAAPSLQSHWFDGRSAQARDVLLQVQGSDLVLRCSGDAQAMRYPLRSVQWPERTRHGQRQTHLPDGSVLQHADAQGWDAWCSASGLKDSAVVRWQQSWRATLWAAMASVVLLVAAWLWGIPLLSQGVMQFISPDLEARLGKAAMEQLESLFLEPSETPQAQQEALRARFAQLVRKASADQDMRSWVVTFYSAPRLGANAFALPGGQIVMTDQLLTLLSDQPDALMGVLAHELAHVQHRDGLDMLVRASLIGAVVGVVLGDAGGFFATVPVVLVQQDYSRDVERRADAFAAQMLVDAGLSPAAMAVFFERLSAQGHAPEQGSLPIAIASHPDAAERVAFFKGFAR